MEKVKLNNGIEMPILGYGVIRLLLKSVNVAYRMQSV